MPSDKVVVICEDIAQDKFIRAWLKKLGFNPKHEVRFIPHEKARLDPQNTRCCSWVKEQYPIHVRQIRSRQTRTQCFLVVGIDADGETVPVMLAMLDGLLTRDAQNPRVAGEGIVNLIPRDEIETWAAFFDGQNPNETADYKATAGKPEVIDKAAKEFAEFACGKTPRPQNELPSLTHAFDHECPRIPRQ